MRFWKVDPFSDSSSVFLREAAEFTGAEGSIHPSPVPVEPETEKTFSDDDVDFLMDDDERRLVEKPDAWWLARKKPTAMEESFMVVVLCYNMWRC